MSDISVCVDDVGGVEVKTFLKQVLFLALE